MLPLIRQAVGPTLGGLPVIRSNKRMTPLGSMRHHRPYAIVNTVINMVTVMIGYRCHRPRSGTRSPNTRLGWPRTLCASRHR